MTLLREPFTARSWAEFGYALVGLPLGLAGFLFSVLSVTAAGVLVATLVGLPLLALAVRGARQLGAIHRALSRALLGVAVDGPAPPVPAGRGFLLWIGAGLRDTGGWRAHAYFLLRFPLAVAAFVVAVGTRVGGAVLVLSPLLRDLGQAPAPPTAGFVPHPFLIRYGDIVFDTWPEMALLVAQGVVMILVAPWVLRPVLALDAVLTCWLLGPSALAERVHELENSRAAVVDGAEVRLRGIERDLHDGAQAQLVAVAMKLGLASEKLAADTVDVGRVRTLVDTALDTARSAITDLRDLIAGIHPPILDAGLPAALATLAARSPVPTDLSVELPQRPSPAIEAIVYFCTAELLTNVAKHSGAQRASIRLAADGPGLRLHVRDDGCGGAGVRVGAGLDGLHGRVSAVDGAIDVDSPGGGPTTITVVLPTETPGPRNA
ncbi:sensor histidine kinase [Pseudonocardia sp. TRM90224]|uniref:sensor histidine kinase n=1 Tax=Pseudonocardia sp. TRM90224 TaxID=2812678 RepID=UPI001E4B510F|nr:sensor histidine kinase [Pseudonocardia sp. TRM90224]